MSLASQISALASRIAQEINDVRATAGGGATVQPGEPAGTPEGHFWFDDDEPAPAPYDAPAGGDLAGTFPNPTIAPFGADEGDVLTYNGSAWRPASTLIAARPVTDQPSAYLFGTFAFLTGASTGWPDTRPGIVVTRRYLGDAGSTATQTFTSESTGTTDPPFVATRSKQVSPGDDWGPWKILSGGGMAPKPATDLPSTYPLGTSYFPVTSGHGYPAPTPKAGMVVTRRIGSGSTIQTFTEKPNFLSERPLVVTRSEVNAGDAWSVWDQQQSHTQFTPTMTGFTTLAASWHRYTRTNNTVHVQASLLISTATGQFGVALPTGSAYMGGQSGVWRVIGSWGALDVGVARYVGSVVTDGVSVAFEINAGSLISNAAPFTWSANDQLNFQYTYELA